MSDAKVTRAPRTRRQILRGAGGFTLGLPFLPSLLTAPRAYGADPVPLRQPRFVAFTTDHGGINPSNMYPDPAALTEKVDLLPGYQGSYGTLRARKEGSDHVLSPVLRAPETLLSERLVAKMNLLRGIDIPFYIGHHSGGHLGNYARNDGNSTEGRMLQASPRPTIDQVLAWSPTFYKDLAGIKERSVVTGSRLGLSWGFSNPRASTGTIQEVRAEMDSRELFGRIFTPPMVGMNPRAPIVDRVLENYRSLRQSNRRLSAGDRQRLDDHLDRLQELQRRLDVTRPAQCGDQPTPTEGTDDIGYQPADPSWVKKRMQLFNAVVEVAFRCGSSRIAVIGVGDHFTTYAGDWHQGIAHQHLLPQPQQMMVDGLRATFRDAVLDLVNRLDKDVEHPGSGATYLENTLVQWTQESGQRTHESPSIPVVTFGSGAGFFKTGLYVDYRNQVGRAGLPGPGGKIFEYAGLTYNRWLGTVLQSMGLPRSEYEKSGVPGYGHPFVGADFKSLHVSGVVESAGDVLPVIKA